MQQKTKFDYEIESFAEAFKEKKDCKIALYGTGRMTATLLERLQGFHIIGLLDRDKELIGKSVYGVKIIGRKEAEQKADILIINTTESYWNVIYNRIKDWNIPIYFRNGQKAEGDASSGLADLEYWNKTYRDLEQTISEYDVISFDIFDTLVMRRVLDPIDVFRLAEKKIRQQLGRDIEFVLYRKKAAGLLTDPTIDEIYEKMQELMNCSCEVCQAMKQCEWETELSLLVGREDIVSFCKSIQKKKEVYFISDMYYSSAMLQDIILRYTGIETEASQIIVSCEKRKSKENGDLWEYYQDTILRGRRAIHVGDNEDADCRKANQQGIDSFWVMNAVEMLKNSSIGPALSDAVTLYASMALGLCISRMFNSPFALHGSKGVVEFKNSEDAGYCLFGGVAYSFLLWVLKQAYLDGTEELLFFAREGYLLIEQYHYFLTLLKTDGPKAVYLEISRRAIMGASVSCKEDIYDLARFPYDGTVKDFFRDRLGVCVEDAAYGNILMADIQKDEKKLFGMLDRYMPEIDCSLKCERKAYWKYFESMGIGDNFAVIDSILYGNTQYYLGKFLGKRTKGYYFSVCLEAGNRCIADNEMKGCFQKETDCSGRDTAVFRYASILEAFFTSPKGMLINIKENGEKNYAERMTNQMKFEIRRQMQKGVLHFIKDMVDLQREGDIWQLTADEQYADFLFGCFMDNGFDPSDELKSGFYYDNGILNRKEVPIWE
ncbi:MAG: hypothetical protein HFI15_01530 [Lachnospiraceae bacterium]|jgi:predicted HAD superfamily hydrolase|nr:hypothetical protein [Lachnospiraceae bacterium]